MKTKQAFNPYLPSYEYVPDAEPHIVYGRLYMYSGFAMAGNPILLDGSKPTEHGSMCFEQKGALRSGLGN